MTTDAAGPTVRLSIPPSARIDHIGRRRIILRATTLVAMKAPQDALPGNGEMTGHGSPAIYSFRLAGTVGETLRQAFPTLDARREGQTTVLTGELPDQAALHGVLALIESLGVELVSVNRLDGNQPHRTNTAHPV
jgi:hypothetical protein